MPMTVEEFVQRLTSSGVMSEEAFRDWIATVPIEQRGVDSESLAKALVKDKRLTKFQAEQIYAGKEKSLTLGNYVILDKLGQGGMGMVLKALHRRMERVVALKVMSAAGMKSPDAVQRFQREVKAAAKLSHPNIVAAHDADEAKGTHFLVMEYVEGSDLLAFVKKHGPLPVEMAVQCILQAARGLEYAHSRGVIHRDIKPANLLIELATGQGLRGEGQTGSAPLPLSSQPSAFTIKILDMGLARIDGAVGGSSEGAGLTQSGQIMGTVDYMSPEQALDTKHADARSDIYSLGCTLYYLLTGRVVYSGDTMMKKLMAHRESPIPSLDRSPVAPRQDSRTSLDAEASKTKPGVDGASAFVSRSDTATLTALNVVFRRMVAKRPEDRPQSMTAVIAELERCLSSGESTVALSSASGTDSGDVLQQFLKEISGESPTNATSGGPALGLAKPLARTAAVEEPAQAETLISSAGEAGTDQRTEQSLTIERTERLPVADATVNQRKKSRRLLLGSVAGLIAVLLAILVAVRGKSETLRLEITDEQVEVTIGDTGQVVKGAKEHTLRVPLGEHVLHVQRDSFGFDTDPIEMAKGKPVEIKVEKIGNRVRVFRDGEFLVSKELPKRNSSSQGAANSADSTNASVPLMNPAGAALEFKKGDSVQIPTLKYDGGPVTVELTVRGGGLPFASAGKSKVVLWGGVSKFSGVSLDVSNTTVVAREQESRLTSTEPHRVAAVFDGQRLLYFIDGKLQALGIANPQEKNEQQGTYIGGVNDQFSFEGMIDEVRISKVARYTADYVPQEQFDVDANTIALYHFDEGEGDTLKDSSGNGHHGKIVGAKWMKLGGAVQSPVDPERAVAEWVINKGGEVAGVDNRGITKIADLPKSPFAVARVAIRNVANFSEADAQRLTQLRELGVIHFVGTTVGTGALRTLAGCPRLYSIQVNGGSTTDTTLAELLEIPKLRSLLLGVPVSDEFVAHLGQLPQLQILSFGSGKQLSEDAFVRLAAAPPAKLQTLYLPPDMKIGVSGLRAIARLPHLQVLMVYVTDVDDAAISELAGSPTLAHLLLWSTRVTQAGTTSLQKALGGCQILVKKAEQAPPLYGPAYRDTIRRLMARGFEIGVKTNTSVKGIRGDDPFPPGDVLTAEQVITISIVVQKADLQLILQLSDLRGSSLEPCLRMDYANCCR